MLGFFFRHYDPWVDRYVVFDDGSTDGSREILAAHPKVDLRTFERRDSESFCLSHQALQNEVWKESRGQADWIVVTAIDEHLHVRGRPMADYLVEQKLQGVTLLPALGFDMNCPHMPSDEGLLVDRVTRGRARIAFNKLSIFDPDAIEETGFGAGRHQAAPVGNLVLPARNEVMLWHYKHLGFERNAVREANQEARLGAKDRALDLAQHYRWSREKLRAFWDQMQRESIDLGAPEFVPDRVCVGPLWWSQRRDIERVRASVAAVPKTVPTVSVLIKSYNHARYVRQTIESILSQSFQDFEIVVTDDASSDETAAIVAGFEDPRIDLVVNERNLGISGAMNATLARARGRYLAILNSDDWALPDRLSRQVDFLDANPHVGIVTGLVRAVDEAGQPTESLYDFGIPLSFPDFSRYTWLRYFLTRGNCLCAPTAMIRREAYEDAGPYDRRLTNLQDFDMWLRMLFAGHTIHVMSEELTAFRIREDAANMSASREDSRIRHSFEASRIMRHYLKLDEIGFEALFGDRAVDTKVFPLARRLAFLALQHTERAVRRFALDVLADIADDDDSLDQLRDLTGEHDAAGVEIERRFGLTMQQLGLASQQLGQATQQIETLHDRTRELDEKLHFEWLGAERLRKENSDLRETVDRLERTLINRAGRVVEQIFRRRATS